MPGGMISGYSLTIRDLKDYDYIEDIQVSQTTFTRKNLGDTAALLFEVVIIHFLLPFRSRSRCSL